MTQSGTLADFIQQIPPGVINLLVLLGFGLVLTAIALVLVRVRKQRMKNNPDSRLLGDFDPVEWLNGLFNSGATSKTRSSASANANNLPDLDMLLGGVETPPPPEPTPVATQAPSPATQTAPPESSTIYRQPGIVNIKTSDGRVVEAAEMVVISRDRQTDNLVVQIGEHAYDGTEDGVHPAFKRQFNKIMRELQDMLPVLTTAKQTDAAPTSEPPLTPPPVATPSPPSTAQPSSPVVPKADADADDAQTFDLAAQIEAFLQQRLTTEPDLSGRRIHVLSAPGGGVQIEVDGIYYESVGDVEDDAVRAYLKTVIADWQAQQ